MEPHPPLLPSPRMRKGQGEEGAGSARGGKHSQGAERQRGWGSEQGREEQEAARLLGVGPLSRWSGEPLEALSRAFVTP